MLLCGRDTGRARSAPDNSAQWQSLLPSTAQKATLRHQVLEAVVANTFEALTDYLRRGVEGRTDAVARLRATCHAYLAFGYEHPEQYAVLFSRPFALPTEVDKTVDNMLGAEAFSFLIDGIRDCVAAGHSDSTQPQEDATALWVALHGYVGLRTAIPDFPWPPDEVVLDNLIDRIAMLT